ncbi:transcriptional regulator [Dysgonomonas sp. 521]|uniref:helix-turn-helix transcriptional regulator n=1 Tax=Dysgonomonas sp. 521 TaxID=2302932 RepID=UPI0013D38C96|nr:helix-turn-helix domain-containing protein [Dysgonomonas sp. 521]NDV97441.1 transcriptional regulator [Dysgonomonas sp. 521]
MPELDIYKKIKDRRLLLGITQQDLADISGVALRTIKQMENGKGNPAIGTLNKVVSVLGMSIDISVKKLDEV